MDLAEIRKKAKSQGRGSAETPKAAPRSAPSIQGVPDPVLPQPAAPFPACAPQPEPAADPLDLLFAYSSELGSAADERNLQALREQEAAEDDRHQWLSFSLGGEEYALEIGGILEIIKPREITDIPRVPDFILGIVSLRGIIIPIFDLRRRLKLGVAELSPASRIIVCQHGERAAGLLADGITQVVRISEQAVEPPPAVLSGIDRELIKGIGRHEGRMLILLDLTGVLNVELT
jgi:purine-binding chemotaxis protein CheW